MCGIVGYIGDQSAYDILIKGLTRLEYRGYDSAGIALIDQGVNIYKCKGRVKDLEAFVEGRNTVGTIGIGHTRWATHGEPNDVNAHPHQSMKGHFTVIHNGIIENYDSIKKKLQTQGYTFQSNTDTEVLSNLIEHIYLTMEVGAEQAVQWALSKVHGAYGLVIICNNEPDKLIAARKGSPLVVGIGEGEYYIASDATPIVEYTKSVVYLNDDNMAIISRKELTIRSIKTSTVQPEIKELDLDISAIEKGGYEHFMLKEIFEQPKSIYDTFRGRVAPELNEIRLGGLVEIMNQFITADKITIIACGTSWHAGLVGEYLFEEYARVPVEVEYGSEFRYRNPVIKKGDIVLAISQSGETADTLEAIKIAKRAGAIVLGICNVVGSSIPRETDGGVYTHAGPEIGVASTKAFTAQVTVLTMMALKLGRKNGNLSEDRFHEILNHLFEIPDKIEQVLKQNDHIKEIATKYKDATNAIYLGRGLNFPVALEGALKLKEISYIHAEGYPAAEMKHGPIALIDENMPIVVIATKDNTYEKIISNIQEVKARKGQVIAVVSEGDTALKGMVDHIIEIPTTHDALTGLLSTVPLQLLSYHIAVMRGCDVDQPRNLAKSVTVE